MTGIIARCVVCHRDGDSGFCRASGLLAQPAELVHGLRSRCVQLAQLVIAQADEQGIGNAGFNRRRQPPELFHCAQIAFQQGFLQRRCDLSCVA